MFFIFHLLGVKGRGTFLVSEHIWPTPLLTHTICGCPNLYESSLKTLANVAALWDNLLLMSCFLGHGPPCEGPPLPKTCAGSTVVVWVCSCCIVVWCGVVCVFKIVVGESKIGRSPDTTPSTGPPSAGQPSLFLGCCSCCFALDSAAAAFLVVPVAVACACCFFWAANRRPLPL